MAISVEGFHSLSDRQRKFLLDKMTDPETGTRHFRIDEEVFAQVWVERLVTAGWIQVTETSAFYAGPKCEIPFDAWDVIAEVKTAS